MPFNGEHAARLKDPGQFDPKSFRRVNGKFGAGVDVIFGKLKSGKGSMVIQTIRFDAKKFTPAQARTWLKDHQYSATLEEASASQKPQKEASGGQEEKAFESPDGIMVALYPSLDIASAVALDDQLYPDALRPEDLHITIAYLGKVAEADFTLPKIMSKVGEIASSTAPIVAKFSGAGQFNPGPDGAPYYLSIDSQEVNRLHQMVCERLSWVGVKASNDHAYTPHMTLAYLQPDDPAPSQPDLSRLRPRFEILTLKWGDSTFEFQLQGQQEPAMAGMSSYKNLALRANREKSRRILRSVQAREAKVKKEFKSSLTAKVQHALRTPFNQYATPVRSSSLFITTTKDGKPRWTTLSSSAFRDRDREIVSTKALLNDIQRADLDGNYGPLRFWHLPGVDIGDCDFNMLHGHILIESGTFRDPIVAQSVKEQADKLEVSIGFIHPSVEPDGDGVYHTIRRFERSLVPKGRVSNRTTQLIV